jgi:hypothetical protein
MMPFPLLTEDDPRVSAEGTIALLGTSVIADALAVLLIPSSRNGSSSCGS